MHKSLLLATTMAGSSLAQSSVVTMFMPFDIVQGGAVGSVVGVDKDKTTYSITCAMASTDCAFGTKFLLTTAPSSIGFDRTAPADDSLTTGTPQSDVAVVGCTSTTANTLTCTGVIEVVAGSSTVMSTSMSSIVAGATSYSLPVTITGSGAGQAGPTPTPSTTAPTGSGSGGSAAPSGTAPAKPNGASGFRATQNAVLTVVAALIGGAAFL